MAALSSDDITFLRLGPDLVRATASSGEYVLVSRYHGVLRAATAARHLQRLAKAAKQELLTPYRAPPKPPDLTGVNLSGLDLDNCDLTDLDLTGVDLSYSSLVGARLPTKGTAR